MTTDEIRDLNRLMYEAFKPEDVSWVPEAGGYFKKGLLVKIDYWSPRDYLDDAVACRPTGTTLKIEIDYMGTFCTVQDLDGEEKPIRASSPIGEPAVAVCLALLDWMEST